MTITKKTLEGMAQTLSETTGENYYICYQYGRAYLYKHTEKGDEYLYPCCGTKSEVYYYMVAINNAVRDYKYKVEK
jgi:hypothetical protein